MARKLTYPISYIQNSTVRSKKKKNKKKKKNHQYNNPGEKIQSATWCLDPKATSWIWFPSCPAPLCGGLPYSESILTVMKKLKSGLCLASGATDAGTSDSFSKIREAQLLF